MCQFMRNVDPGASEWKQRWMKLAKSVREIASSTVRCAALSIRGVIAVAAAR
jgi:hypothetical protein